MTGRLNKCREKVRLKNNKIHKRQSSLVKVTFWWGDAIYKSMLKIISYKDWSLVIFYCDLFSSTFLRHSYVIWIQILIISLASSHTSKKFARMDTCIIFMKPTSIYEILSCVITQSYDYLLWHIAPWYRIWILSCCVTKICNARFVCIHIAHPLQRSQPRV